MKRFIALVVAFIASIGVSFAAVNVNTADREELESLKEIGPVKAQAIIDYRAKNGPFRSLDDLDKVKGIGKVTLAAIKDEVTFSGPNTGVSAMKRDNRASDQADARVQRGDSMSAPERATRREESRDEKREAKAAKKASHERIARNEAPLDLNSASEKDLEKLPGVGAARAKAIVHGRPYRAKNDLVDKRVIPQDVYDRISDRIVARQKQNDPGAGG